MDTAGKFTTLQLQESVTYDSTNTSAVDGNAPLSFLDWVKYFSNVASDPTYLLNEYKRYVESWFEVKTTSPTIKQNIIKELYISLFRNIAVNYLTAEEKRFISNADLTNQSDLVTILPLLVSKIKNICLHYASLRERAKSAVYDYNIKGSEYSIEKIIHEELSQSFLDPEINKSFLQAGVTPETLKDIFKVSFEDSYDMGTDYFDVNASLPVSAYNTSGDQTSMFAANSYPFDTNLFVDFNTSVVAAINSYPVIVEELGTNFSINLTFTENDLQYLKDQDFTTLVNNLDASNLRLNVLAETLKQFSGTTFFYLSTNAVGDSTYGELFKADAFSNYLNRRFPTVAAVEGSNVQLESKVGRFFRPDKLGILNFLAFNVHGVTASLSADTLYVFPDPSVYGNISGLSRTKFNTPFTFPDDVYGLKFNQTNTFRFGEAVSDFFTKFKGYQSRSETLNWDATGPSRTQDPVEFFTGVQKINWANSDVFPISRDGRYPITDRQETLLTNNKTLFQHRADIYNNEYALYKEIYRFDDPAALLVREESDQLTCLTFDGHTLCDAVSGYSFNFDVVNDSLFYSGVTLNTLSGLTLSAVQGVIDAFSLAGIPLSALGSITTPLTSDPILSSVAYAITAAYVASDTFNYVIQSVGIYPELDFYKTIFEYSISVYDGQNFKYTDSSIQDLSTFNQLSSAYNVYEESGPFLLNEEDASPILYDRSFAVQNTLVGATLSSAETQLISQTGTLSADLSLYNQHDTYGDFYFRSYNSTQVIAGSAALSAIFVKYDTDLITELFATTKTIDIVLNTLFIESENHIVFEKLEYDQSSYQFTTYPSNRTAVSRGNITKFSKFSNTWYSKDRKEIYIACTNIVSSFSATNAKTLYFDLYVYDFEKVAPIVLRSTDTYFRLSATVLYNTNIVESERPILTYDIDFDTYSLKCLLKDVSNMFYQLESKFKLDNYNRMYNIEQRVFVPDMFLHSENFVTSAFSSLLETKYVSCTGGSLQLTNGELVIAYT